MAWKTDQYPIDYLKRRIIYYKKKKGSVRSLKKNINLINKYGEKKLSLMITDAIIKINVYITEFEKAIKKLES